MTNYILNCLKKKCFRPKFAKLVRSEGDK